MLERTELHFSSTYNVKSQKQSSKVDLYILVSVHSHPRRGHFVVDSCFIGTFPGLNGNGQSLMLFGMSQHL